MVQVLASRAALALSDDVGIECLITDIPLLCIGILSMGVLTFMVFMKRVDVLIMLLFASCFFGFIAAIIDLGQILIRGYINVAIGLHLSQVSAFLRAREVFLSLAVGFLYLFYWLFAARRPISKAEDAEAEPILKGMIPIESRTKPLHCARWERWGYVGIGLKWGSLLACLLIVALQMGWRLSPRHHLYGNLYVASATLETTISAVFVLKLLLNLYLTPSPYQRRVLLSYLAPMAAFALSSGVAVGNIVVFSFSETSLGRFLRGTEAYLLVVYYIILVFRDEARQAQQTPFPEPPTTEIYDNKEKEFVTARPETHVYVPTTNIVPSTRRPSQSLHGIWQINRFSNLSNISSWVASNRNSRRSLPLANNRSQAQSWNSDIYPPNRSLLLQTSAAFDDRLTNEQDGPSQRYEPSGKEFNSLPPRLSLHTSVQRPLTDFSFSYYGMDDKLVPPRSLAYRDSSAGSSPIYGLNGIILPTPKVEKKELRGDKSPVTKLMEEQSELDASIAVLRNQTDSRYNTDKDNLMNSRRTTASPTDTTRDTSKLSSPHASVFSLSVFPDPPEVATPQTSFRDLPMRPSFAVATPRPRKKRMPGSVVIPIRLDIPSQTGSNFDLGGSSGYDSAVTQYDVTSFIGDLSGPQSGYPLQSGNLSSSGIIPATGALSDVESLNESEVTTPQAQARFEKQDDASMMEPLSRTPSRPLGSATMSSSVPKQTTNQASSVPPQNMALRTFLARNGNGSLTATSPLGSRMSPTSPLTSIK